jgi:hypothetical protein
MSLLPVLVSLVMVTRTTTTRLLMQLQVRLINGQPKSLKSIIELFREVGRFFIAWTHDYPLVALHITVDPSLAKQNDAQSRHYSRKRGSDIRGESTQQRGSSSDHTYQALRVIALKCSTFNLWSASQGALQQ